MAPTQSPHFPRNIWYGGTKAARREAGMQASDKTKATHCANGLLPETEGSLVTVT
jgi:hypothetical protein